MKPKTIVISCVPPKFTSSQEAAMFRLLHELESRGFKVYLYSPSPHPEFDAYIVKKLHYAGPGYKYYLYKTLLKMNRKTWKARIKKNFYLPDDYNTHGFLKARIKEAVKYFRTVKPVLYIGWNPNSAALGIMSVTARMMGIKTGAIEWGLLPETYILDRGGTLASSAVFNRHLTYTDPDVLFKTGEQVFDELSVRSISLYAQPEKTLPAQLLAHDEGQTRVLVLGIDAVDSAAYPIDDPEREGLLPFHLSSFAQAEAFAEADPSFRVIFKPHPAHNDYQHDQQAADNLWVINSNPDQLIEWADVVVCTGSKMELSVLLKKKPLVTVGAGLLYNKGCTYEVRHPAQLQAKILEAKYYGVTASQLHCFKQFLGYLKCHYLYVFDTAHDNTEVIDRLLEGI